jgi:hypothetical protein
MAQELLDQPEVDAIVDGAKLAELVADKEGLELMSPEAKAGLDEARRGVTECNTARQRAVTELSRAESAALAAARRDRLDELAPIMLAILTQDTAQRKPTHALPDWVAPPELLRELQLRAAHRPDLATGGMPGSRFPASVAYRPAFRAISELEDMARAYMANDPVTFVPAKAFVLERQEQLMSDGSCSPRPWVMDSHSPNSAIVASGRHVTRASIELCRPASLAVR